MNDNDISLIVCSPKDALRLAEGNEEIKESLVVCERIEPGIAVVVKLEDFLDLLVKGESYELKEDSRE